jgi:hypothetical protein
MLKTKLSDLNEKAILLTVFQGAFYLLYALLSYTTTRIKIGHFAFPGITLFDISLKQYKSAYQDGKI